MLSDMLVSVRMYVVLAGQSGSEYGITEVVGVPWLRNFKLMFRLYGANFKIRLMRLYIMYSALGLLLVSLGSL